MLDTKMNIKIKGILDLSELNINWGFDNDEQIIRSLIRFIMRKEDYEKRNKYINKIIEHSYYVERYGMDLLSRMEEHNTKENKDVIRIAATYHDIGKVLEFVIDNYDDKNHAEYSAYLTSLILNKQCKYEKEKILEITQVIKNHSNKGSKCPDDATVLDKVLMDADLLDERTGSRWFKLCTLKYNEEIFARKIEKKLNKKVNDNGGEISKKEIKKIIKKCKRDNLNNEDRSLFLSLQLDGADKNRAIITEKMVLPDYTKELFEDELKLARHLFDTSDLFEMHCSYYDELLELLGK
jgi:putative nucleotidyltransferase with HDIG domain